MKNKALPKIVHGQLYKSALWATIIVFSVATLMAVFMILFDGFTSLTSRMLFVMWQVFWFGLIAIILARFYERNTFTLARCIAVAAVVCCALLLMVGIYQAVLPMEHYYDYDGRYVQSDIDVVITKIQMIMSIFVYVSVLLEWHLMVKSDARAVVLARDITAGIMTVAILILDVMIITEFDNVGDIMVRLTVVMLILAVTGMIVTRILASIYSKDNRPTELTQMAQNDNSMRARLIERMKETTGRSEGECVAIVNVFENGHLLGRQAKSDLVKGLIDNLAMSEEEADKVYDNYISIMMSEFMKQ